MGAIASDCVCQSASVGMIGTVERARGRWREILPLFGIDSRFLKNKHGPCPLCGGKDRFRFDDKNGEGTYYCNQCGPGPGVMLLRKKHRWDHATACREIERILGSGSLPHRERRSGPRTAPERAAESIKRALDE